MDSQDAIDLGQQALMTVMMVGAPILIVGLVVGLTIGLLQALTQVQDQTVSFVPKIVAMIIAAAICLPWLVQTMTDYAHEIISNIPAMISGG